MAAEELLQPLKSPIKSPPLKYSPRHLGLDHPDTVGYSVLQAGTQITSWIAGRKAHPVLGHIT